MDQTDEARLERAMANLVFQFPNVSGATFQKIALRVIDGYFDDHQPLYSLGDVVRELGRAMDRTPLNAIEESKI